MNLDIFYYKIYIIINFYDKSKLIIENKYKDILEMNYHYYSLKNYYCIKGLINIICEFPNEKNIVIMLPMRLEPLTSCNISITLIIVLKE